MQAVAHPSGEGDGVALMQLRLGTVSGLEMLDSGFSRTVFVVRGFRGCVRFT